MAKKKKAVRRKKKVFGKKAAKKKSTKRKRKKKAVKKALVQSEKVVARVEHFFGNIAVAAFRLKAPLQVGDVIHVKGHTTDFIQRVDSMQIEHENVSKAKKGQDVGIKVKTKVRPGDMVFLSAKGLGIMVQQRPTARLAPRPNQSDPYGNTKFLKF